MKKLFLSLFLWLGLSSLAAAQCVGAGGVNAVPQSGVNCQTESLITTYAATSVGLVPGAAATDIACISGSATQVVRVLAIHVSGTGTAITIPIIITKHISADSGGTPATSTALPAPYRLDSGDPAPTATTTAWTANPTINDATPGIIDSAVLPLAAASATGSNTEIEFDYFSRVTSKAPILRGVAQQVCVNLNGTSPTASLFISFRWSEAAQ